MSACSMDARVYLHLLDSIASAGDARELRTARALVAATDLAPIERRVLERVMETRQRELRRGDAAVAIPVQRGD